MTVELVHKLANRLDFRVRQVGPIRQVAEEALAVAGEDSEFSDAASACLGAAAALEGQAAGLVKLLRRRRDEASARAMDRLQAAEGPRSNP